MLFERFDIKILSESIFRKHIINELICIYQEDVTILFLCL